MSYIFSSESVTKGHPDKVADFIADSILDYCLSVDKTSRCAVEVSVTGRHVFIYGEVTTKADLSKKNVIRIAKEAIISAGYNDPKYGFNAKSNKYIVLLDKQSADIALGVNHSNGDIGAGDQGIMFGFSKDDTKALMPLAISLAHELTEKLTSVREEGIIKGLGPDGKSQVSVLYDEDDNPKEVTAVVLSSQHDEDKDLELLKKELLEEVIKKTIPKNLLTKNTKYFINPTGRFVVGGPVADAGLTGRKLMVDTYGGYARHGGGALSGKDATKVDRSAAYMARYLSKQIVGSKIARKCEVQLAYAIGIKEPVSIYVNTYNTGKVSDDVLVETILNNFDLTPKGIIDKLNLTNPVYKSVVNNGHFGKLDLNHPWELLDKVDVFKKLIK